MRYFSSRIFILFLAVAVCAFPLVAQETSPAQQQPQGKVIFSRSIDENGETNTQQAAEPTRPIGEPASTDAERAAVSYTDFDLTVHLNTAEKHIAVRALVTVRNDGKVPLARIPLQISSSLNWEQIRIGGKDATFTVAKLNSDADHTGQLHEAEIVPDVPLEPGASLPIDVVYSGTIQKSTQRLLAIGTPEDVAAHSDWDEVSTQFTGLRGFGNVVWYPASSVPVILGDGARLFDEIGSQKRRLSGAHFRLRLAIEYPYGQAPTVALVNGQSITLHAPNKNLPSDVISVANAELKDTTLGFDVPSLFVAVRKPTTDTNATIWSLPENHVSVPMWITALHMVAPFLQKWLGMHPQSTLTLLDLPEDEDAPFETGSMLATSLRQATADQMNSILAHTMTHAWVRSPHAWLDEGLAYFMNTLWAEKQSNRTQALGMLEASRPALALIEPDSPGQDDGQSMDTAISPIYYRTKAAYIFWMLRDATGDVALSAALRAYYSSPDKDVSTFENSIKQASIDHDLSWIFSDWIHADKGLPDLSIEAAYSSAISAGNWMIAVHVNNAGSASVEVPVIVRSANATAMQRVLVPAHSVAVQRILVQGKPTEVQVNDGAIPETDASVHVTKLIQVTESPTPAPEPGKWRHKS